RLDTQTVQRRRTVQQYRVLANNFGQNVPHLRQLALNHFLGSFDRRRQTTVLQLAKNKRLEQLQRHLLGQTALMQTQRRSYHDDRTTAVVDSLTQQVLTEATLLTLHHVSQRRQLALVSTGDGPATTTVIQQRIDRFRLH